SRPRRFGKSLTLSTLESIFSGEKELFKGLYIYDQDYDWKKYPVIRLALNQLSSSTAEKLDKNIANELDYIGKKYGVTLSSTDAPQKFKELIRELYDAYSPVVILIDEYDKPILDNILEKECVSEIRTLLKKFYGIVKASEEYLRFTFITGVSKFTQVSIFSDLNNLTDITLDPEFATICGFTQAECEHYFAEWIEENAVKLSMTRDEYLAKIKETYDGIRFTKKEAPVYNPVSFTRAMQHGDFAHYWFETGTPTFLLKLLKERFDSNTNEKRTIADFESLELTADGFSSYEIENLKPEPLLFQTGYLTIKDYDPESDLYTLSYPNKEVRSAFVKRLADYFTEVGSEVVPSLVERIRKGFLNDDMDEVFYVLQVFYAKIDNTIKIKQEKYYQTVFYILFTLLGYRIKAEVNTNKGRMDAVIKTDKIIYIFEFKLNKTPKEAIEQIKQREYYRKYLLENKTIKLIGVQFNQETGEIKEWEIEKKPVTP
ncbi:MAG TPA: AAA family ATPase, partial [bacterium]|nr:AAA family ATPase [bacterium]